MESWDHGFCFGYSTGMALSCLWLLNPENHYSAYRLAHVNTDSVQQGLLTSWQHVQLQSRNETQSGPILCGKAVSIWNLALSLPIHVCYADKSLEISTVSINMKKYASPSAFPLYCGGYVCLSITYLLWFFFPSELNWTKLFSHTTWRAK